MSSESTPGDKVIGEIVDDKAGIREEIDFTDAEWIGAPLEDGSRGVEVAFVDHKGTQYIGMRNGDDPDSPVLVFTTGEWDAFVEGAKDGEFDEPWDEDLPAGSPNDEARDESKDEAGA